MKLTKKKAASLAGLLVAGAMSAAALAPEAHADSYDFTVDAYNAGFYNSRGTGAQLSVGYSVCNDIAAGYRPLAVARNLWRASPLSAYDAGRFVGIAVRDLCPEYTYLAVGDVIATLGYGPSGPSSLA